VLSFIDRARGRDQNRQSEIDLTLDYLLDLILKQNGRCYISGKPLVFQKHCDWQCSLERLDNTRWYTKGNVAFICLEFQSTDTSRHRGVAEDIEFSGQWTPEIAKELFFTCD
jgi:hypothetical protein